MRARRGGRYVPYAPRDGTVDATMRYALVPLLVLLALATGGCPVVSDDGDPELPTDVAEPEDETATEDRERAVAAAGEARSSLFAAAEDLEEAARAFDTGEGRQLASRAVHGLTASRSLRDDLPAVEVDRRPFLPGDEDAEPQDVLNRVLGVARAVGEQGAPVVSVLDDPVAGDVTGWQQEPGDRNEAIADAADVAGEDVVESLEGHVPRAVAWTIAAIHTGDQERFTEFMERAAAHVAVAIAALDETIRVLEGDEDVDGDAAAPVEVGGD
jgi:hypothetical protein